MAGNGSGAWTAFLVMAFGVLGLVGVFSTYLPTIPVGRAVARLEALDRVRDGGVGAVDRDALGDSAGRVLEGGAAGLGERVAVERARVIAGLPAEVGDVAFRARVVMVVFTGAAALFGVAVLSIVRRESRE